MIKQRLSVQVPDGTRTRSNSDAALLPEGRNGSKSPATTATTTTTPVRRAATISSPAPTESHASSPTDARSPGSRFSPRDSTKPSTPRDTSLLRLSLGAAGSAGSSSTSGSSPLSSSVGSSSSGSPGLVRRNSFSGMSPLSSSRSVSMHEQLSAQREHAREIKFWREKFPEFSDDDVAYVIHRFDRAKSADDGKFLTERTFTRLLRKYDVTNTELIRNMLKLLDTDCDENLTLENIFTLFNYSVKGTPEDQAKWCFRVYNLSKDGFVSRDEVFKILSRSIDASEAQKSSSELSDLTDLVMKKFGQHALNRSMQKITQDEFVRFALSNPFDLEFLGVCRVRIDK